MTQITEEQLKNGISGSSRMLIPRPSKDQFEFKAGSNDEHMLKAPQVVFIFDRVDYPTPEKPDSYGHIAGTYVYLKGLLHPSKGFPTPETSATNDIVKRFMMELIMFYAKHPVQALFLMRKKTMIAMIKMFCSFSAIVLARHFMKETAYSHTTRELTKAIDIVLDEMKMNFKGIDFPFSAWPSKVIPHLLEYDNAYMFRFQDLMNETSAEMLIKNPGKEIARLVKLFVKRDKKRELGGKIKAVGFLVRMAFYYPGVKRAFRKAIEGIDFSKLQMDEIDRYNVLRWDGYDFFGQPLEVRAKKFIDLHGGKAPQAYIVQSTPPQ